MIDLRRTGSFDDEPDEMRHDATKWVLKAYGPTSTQRRLSCRCPVCRSEQEVGEADVAAFFAYCEALRTRLLKPPLLFNDTIWEVK